VNPANLSLRLITMLAIVWSTVSVPPSAAYAAAIITINDLAEGVLPGPTVVGQPPDVPGIQNVVAGNEMLSFTYDDLPPCCMDRSLWRARSGRYRRAARFLTLGQSSCHSKRTKIAVNTSRSSGTE
jgi:hypothetical protein